MDDAVKRVLAAAESGESVVVYGDYDADGITGTVLLLEILESIGINASHYIPDRFSEGYGLHHQSITRLREKGADLIITVDCGIRSVYEVERAKESGLDIIITDHHRPGEDLPLAAAVINPKQINETYPFQSFAGVGLAYKLGQALMLTKNQDIPDGWLELVAIGTVSDLAPLLDENRYLVAKGIEQLNRTSRPGLIALMDIAGIEKGRVSANSIGFGIGPRINAAGRIDSADTAVELLRTTQMPRAYELAKELDSLNRRRQKLTADTVDEVRMIISGRDGDDVLFAAKKGFHEGIVGLAASRIADEYYRPVIVATMKDDFTRGSARSIPGFHITEALDECSELLVQYGGHSSAAGFTVATPDVHKLQNKLNELAGQHLSESDRIPKIEIDVEVELGNLDWELLNFIERLEPCGMGNPSPLFGSRQLIVTSYRAVGKDLQHLKLTLRQGDHFFDAIAFRQGPLVDKMPTLIDAAFNFERNIYMGYESLQLNVQEIRANDQ